MRLEPLVWMIIRTYSSRREEKKSYLSFQDHLLPEPQVYENETVVSDCEFEDAGQDNQKLAFKKRRNFTYLFRMHSCRSCKLQKPLVLVLHKRKEAVLS